MIRVRAILGALVVACLVSACGPWQRAAEAWRARDGGSRPYATLEGTRWAWRSAIQGPDVISVTQPDRYTVEFQNEHRISVRADCNRGQGAWSAKLDTMTIGPMAYTRVACAAGSLSRMFVKALENTRLWYVREGALFLELPDGRGVLRFELVDASVS